MSDLCVTLVSKKLIYKRKLRFLETAQALISNILNRLWLYRQALNSVYEKSHPFPNHTL